MTCVPAHRTAIPPRQSALKRGNVEEPFAAKRPRVSFTAPLHEVFNINRFVAVPNQLTLLRRTQSSDLTSPVACPVRQPRVLLEMDSEVPSTPMAALSLAEVMDVQADGVAAVTAPAAVLQERSNSASAPDPQNKALVAEHAEALPPRLGPPSSPFSAPATTKPIAAVASQSLDASDSDPFGIRPARGSVDGRQRSIADVPKSRPSTVPKDAPMLASTAKVVQETRILDNPPNGRAPQIADTKVRAHFDVAAMHRMAMEVAKQSSADTCGNEARASELTAQMQRLQDSNRDLSRRLVAAEAREAELRGKVDGLVACCETARNEAATSMELANRAEALQEKLRQELHQVCEASKKQLQHRIDLQTRLREALRDAVVQSEAMKHSKAQLQTEQEQRRKVETELEKYRALSSQAMSAERHSREALLAARSRQADELERRVQAHSEAKEASQQADCIRRWSSHMSQLLRRVQLSWHEEVARSRLTSGSDVDVDAMRSTASWLSRAEVLFEQVCKSAAGLLPEQPHVPEGVSSPLLEAFLGLFWGVG
mmetsp:Transcript_966/g.2692  ORF Transcript_966/g.2692 Transcript_966/m.2692 type:complete len:542 (+) Transcript_966:58-1683(+)